MGGGPWHYEPDRHPLGQWHERENWARDPEEDDDSDHPILALQDCGCGSWMLYRLEGHCSGTVWHSPWPGEDEEEEELLPLGAGFACWYVECLERRARGSELPMIPFGIPS